MSRPSTSVLLAVRLLLVALAGGAVVAAFVARRGPDGPGAASNAPGPPGSVLYSCPMHVQVTSRAPGDCPICRMALERVQPPTAAPGGEAASLSLAEVGSLRAFDAVSRVKPYEISLEMRGLAWADSAAGGVVLLHRDEAALVASGETALFYPSSGVAAGRPPGVAVRIKATPPEPWDGATALLRFEAAPPATLAPGVTGTVKLATRLRRDLVVRASAILRSPEGPYVLIVSGDRRTLTRRPVEIGNVIYGYATIVSGLREDEQVAAKRAFFLDAERRRGAGEAL